MRAECVRNAVDLSLKVLFGRDSRIYFLSLDTRSHVVDTGSTNKMHRLRYLDSKVGIPAKVWMADRRRGP